MSRSFEEAVAEMRRLALEIEVASERAKALDAQIERLVAERRTISVTSLKRQLREVADEAAETGMGDYEKEVSRRLMSYDA